MIVSSGSMIESVSVCTSNVALDALFSVTTGVIGLKSVPDVAVPLICNTTCTSPPRVAAAHREGDLAAFGDGATTGHRDLGEVVR